jgi:hypothetical protein
VQGDCRSGQLVGGCRLPWNACQAFAFVFSFADCRNRHDTAHDGGGGRGQCGVQVSPRTVEHATTGAMRNTRKGDRPVVIPPAPSCRARVATVTDNPEKGPQNGLPAVCRPTQFSCPARLLWLRSRSLPTPPSFASRYRYSATRLHYRSRSQAGFSLLCVHCSTSLRV